MSAAASGDAATAEGCRLVEAIGRHARERGPDVALIFSSGGPDQTTMTYRALDDSAHAFAERLIAACPDGGHVLLPMRSDPLSVVALLGCLYAGLACAPVPVPKGEVGRQRLGALAANPNCTALAATSNDLLKFAAAIDTKIVLIDDQLGPRHNFLPQARGEDLALVQYTSGSGSDPKGVMLTHTNVSANLEMLRMSLDVGPKDRFASWLPLFHDMGLAMLLMPLCFGRPGILMPPMSFIRDPARWLGVIGANGATITCAPNFAYELCARRIAAEVVARLDLSCLRLALNGAEPVRRSTMRLFSERFAPAGFRASAFFLCYGLAEAVVFVAGGHLDEEEIFARDETSASGTPMHIGSPAEGTVIAIIDADLRPVPDGAVGEICVAGPNVGSGYLGQPDITNETFDIHLDGYPGLRFLRTGDLGSLQGGRLTIAGRLKDVIIHRGVNLHAPDVEDVVAFGHPALGEGAAFASEQGGTEEVVIVQEIARCAVVDDHRGMLRAAEEAVAVHFGIRPFDVVLVRAGAIPRTTSGKVRRGTCRQRYEAGTLNILHSSREMRQGHSSFG